MHHHTTRIAALGRTSCKALALAVAVAVCSPVHAAAAQPDTASEAVVNFDIPAGDLSVALEKFSTQSGIQAMYRQELVAGKHAPAVKGSLAPAAALAQLLSGAGLTSERVNATTYVLKAAPKAKRGNAEPEQKPEADNTPRENAANERIHELDGLVVVGSRLGSSPVESAMPIKLITREDIDRSGAMNIAQALSYLSEVSVNSGGDREIGAGSALADGGNTNSTTVQMRGMSRGTTLVLINGRRAGNSGMFSSSGQFDLSTIPLALVERIEVLPAGSSAVYGGDGLAGVVNVVLRRDGEGFEVRLRKTAADGYGTSQAGVMWGKAWSRGNLTMAANWQKSDGLFSDERSLTANQDFTRFGGRDMRSTSGNPATVYSLDGCPPSPSYCSLPLPNRGNLPGLDSPVATVPIGHDGHGLVSGDFGATQGQVNRTSHRRHIRSAEESRGFNLNGRIELTPQLELFTEFTYTKREVPAYQYPFTISLGEYGIASAVVPAENPYNPFGVPVGIDYYFGNTGIYTDYSQEYYRGLLGATGKLGRFTWEISQLQSRDKGASRGADYFDADKIAAVLASKDPAVMINPFVGDGSAPATRQVLDTMLSRDLNHIAGSRTDVLTGFIRGPLVDLPSGSLQVLLGGERQRQAILMDSNSSAIVSPQFHGASRSRAIFAETRVPIMPSRESGGHERLAMTGAMRVETSDRSKERTHTETIGVEARPSDAVLLRATYSTAFRPIIAHDAVQEPTSIRQYILDPKLGAGYYVDVLQFGGAPDDLVPERSKTKTIGVVYRPSSSWSASATYWDIRFRNRIAYSSPYAMMQSESLYPHRIKRDPVTGLVEFLDARQLNIAMNDVSGVDIGFEGYLDTSAGQFLLGLSATYTRDHQQKLTPESPVVSNVSVLNSAGWAPRWKIVPRLGWEPNSWLSAMLTGRYVSSYRDSSALSTGPKQGIYRRLGDFWMFDLNVDMAVGRVLPRTSAFADARLSIGAANLFNRLPSFCAGCGFAGYDASQYDIVGRNIYAEFRIGF